MKTMIGNYTPILFSLLFLFCKSPESKKENIKSKNTAIKFDKHPDFNNYWYVGKAEITSYKLSQVRYGEVHEGTAVNIFVTEDFLPQKQVKADSKNEENIPILKLNSTKKYTTGIYPYSLMTSTFSPININHNALKISFSAQEWCGNTFVQLNNRNDYEIQFFSYFESNADRKIKLKKDILENELWNQLRISPENLPVGKLQIIPSFEYLGLHHKKFQAYEALATLEEIADLCRIKKNLTFHIARHTFATTITLSNGVPIETVSKLLGHTKIATTQIYAKVVERKVSEDIFRLKKTLLDKVLKTEYT